MPWFKVDDGFHGHPKVIGLPASAVGLWLLAGTWAAQYLTDGHVPRGMVGRFGGTDADAAELIGAGLWHPAESGYQFHEWHEYQPTKDEVEAERAAARNRMRERRRNQKGQFAGSSAEQPKNFDGSSPTPTQPSPARPSPSQPEPSKEGSERPRKRGTRIPEPFMLTHEMRDWAAEEVPLVDVDASTRRFVDYWRAESGAKATKLDWVSTWRNWLRRDADSRKTQRLTPTERAQQTAAAGRNVAGQKITTLDLKEIA